VLVALLVAVGRRASPAPPRGLAARLEAAGVRASGRELMAAKAGAAALAVPVAALAGVPPAAALAAPVAAFVLPDAWLRQRIRGRAAAMAAELPDVLDLLAVALAAGMSPSRAIGEVGRRHAGCLAAELRRAGELAMLGVPREEVYAALERRCPAPGVPALVAALKRAERHGTPLADALGAQAADARARRARLAAERAARASPQIQLVVALVLVPSAMLLVAAALAPAVLGR
jgi:tight adherence protein C